MLRPLGQKTLSGREEGGTIHISVKIIVSDAGPRQERAGWVLPEEADHPAVMRGPCLEDEVPSNYCSSR
jgi:hypothetical protein